MTEENVQGGFRGAGLVPFDLEKVISQLDLRFKTPTPPTSRPGTAQSWVSKTPNNLIEANSQSTFLKNRVIDHPGSSPTKSLIAIDHIDKGMKVAMHGMALLKAENQKLQLAMELLSKRRRAKKIRLRNGGSLSVQEAEDRIAEIKVDVQVKDEARSEGGRKPRTEVRARRCGNCGEAGHNARTCQIVIEISEEDDSE